MAKPKKKIKGVTSINRNSVKYWYAHIEGKKRYCGKDAQGYKIAVAAKAKEISKKYENKEINAGLKVKKIEFKTVKDLSDWYMQLPTVKNLKSYPQKISRSKHLLAYFDKIAVNQVEADDIETYREQRRMQKAAHGTIDNEVADLSAMYNLAVKRKKFSADLMPGEFVKKRQTNPRRIITDEEFKALLNHADPEFQDILICGYESAMRASEIRNLTAGQIHLDIQHISGAYMDYIDLGIFDTKTRARRTVPVSPKLKEVLKQGLKSLNPDDFVFTFDGRKINKDSIKWKMKAVCKKAEIIYGDKALNQKGERVGIVFHCLRHTRTTKWVEMGFSDEIVRRATGHKSLEAYQQYIKLDPSVVMNLVKNPKTDKFSIKSVQSL